MPSQPIDCSGRILTRMDLAMFQWVQSVMIVQMYQELQLEMSKVVSTQTEMAGLTNMAAGMQHFQLWEKSQHPVGYLT